MGVPSEGGRLKTARLARWPSTCEVRGLRSPDVLVQLRALLFGVLGHDQLARAAQAGAADEARERAEQQRAAQVDCEEGLLVSVSLGNLHTRSVYFSEGG